MFTRRDLHPSPSRITCQAGVSLAVISKSTEQTVSHALEETGPAATSIRCSFVCAKLGPQGCYGDVMSVILESFVDLKVLRSDSRRGPAHSPKSLALRLSSWQD